LTITGCYLGEELIAIARSVPPWWGRQVPSMGFPILGMEYIFGGNSSLYIIFNAKFVGKDPLEETVGTRSCEIGSEIHRELGNGEFEERQNSHRSTSSFMNVKLKIPGQIWNMFG
jgi:hypothetical protein